MARGLVVAAALAGVAFGAAPPADPPAAVPLFQMHFPWTNLPYKADTDPTGRGPQAGYNRCNSTTEGPNSLCQTAVLNSLADFCLWAPPTPNSAVGDTEGAMVAWCTQPGHGTRVIPKGAITGVTFVKTPDYVQVTGHFNQAMLNMQADDGGGELDPHGADQRGNPLGGLVYSNNLPTNPTPGGNNYGQVSEWHNFMGSNVFCFKACDPKGPRAAQLCQHIYDRIGCDYNAPAAYVDGVFESCDGESQDPPGVYTGPDGKTTSYQQPPESLGPIASIPYTARMPKSSNCVPAQSSSLFANAPNPSGAVSSSAPPISSTAAPSSSGPAASSGGAAPTKPSGSAAAPSSSKSSGALAARSVDGAAFVTTAALGLIAMIAGVAIL